MTHMCAQKVRDSMGDVVLLIQAVYILLFEACGVASVMRSWCGSSPCWLFSLNCIVVSSFLHLC